MTIKQTQPRSNSFTPWLPWLNKHAEGYSPSMDLEDFLRVPIIHTSNEEENEGPARFWEDQENF